MSQVTNEELPSLLIEIGQWAQVTFPDEGVAGKLIHLKEEVQELIDAPNDRDEWADCFLLLFDAARKQGLSFNDVANAINLKFQKNKLRTWTQDQPGVYHHVKAA